MLRETIIRLRGQLASFNREEVARLDEAGGATARHRWKRRVRASLIVMTVILGVAGLAIVIASLVEKH